jgi:hypothetical protein
MFWSLASQCRHGNYTWASINSTYMPSFSVKQVHLLRKPVLLLSNSVWVVCKVSILSLSVDMCGESSTLCSSKINSHREMSSWSVWLGCLLLGRVVLLFVQYHMVCDSLISLSLWFDNIILVKSHPRFGMQGW